MNTNSMPSYAYNRKPEFTKSAREVMNHEEPLEETDRSAVRADDARM